MKITEKMSLRSFALLVGMMFLSLATFAQEAADNEILSVYAFDQDGPMTNLRNKAKGAIVGQIPASEAVILNLDRAENGWWHMVNGEVIFAEIDSITVVNNGTAWIHNSVIAVATRNYGGERLRLRESPSENSRAVYLFSDEIQLRPIDIKGVWVKVKTLDGKHTGWIDREWLCGNPLTNCN